MRFGRCPRCGLVIQEGQLKCPQCFLDIEWNGEGNPLPKPEGEGGKREQEDGEGKEDCKRRPPPPGARAK